MVKLKTQTGETLVNTHGQTQNTVSRNTCQQSIYPSVPENSSSKEQQLMSDRVDS